MDYFELADNLRKERQLRLQEESDPDIDELEDVEDDVEDEDEEEDNEYDDDVEDDDEG